MSITQLIFVTTLIHLKFYNNWKSKYFRNNY